MNGKFPWLTPAEANAVHECLTWGRQGNNNKILQLFGTNYEAFTAACAKYTTFNIIDNYYQLMFGFGAFSVVFFTTSTTTTI